MRKAAREQREFVESNNQVTGYDVASVAAHAEYLGCIRVTFFVFGFIETTNPWYEIIRNRQLILWEKFAKSLAQLMAPQWRLKSLWGEGSSRTQTFHRNWVQKGPCHHHPGKATFHMAEWKKASGHLAQVSDATAHLGSRAAPIRPSNVTKLDWLALSPVRKSIEPMFGSSRVIFSPRCRKYKKHPRAGISPCISWPWGNLETFWSMMMYSCEPWGCLGMGETGTRGNDMFGAEGLTCYPKPVDIYSWGTWTSLKLDKWEERNSAKQLGEAACFTKNNSWAVVAVSPFFTCTHIHQHMRELINYLDTTSEVCSIALTPCFVSYWNRTANQIMIWEKTGWKNASKRLLDETSSTLWYKNSGTKKNEPWCPILAVCSCITSDCKIQWNPFPKHPKTTTSFCLPFKWFFTSYFSTNSKSPLFHHPFGRKKNV